MKRILSRACVPIYLAFLLTCLVCGCATMGVVTKPAHGEEIEVSGWGSHFTGVFDGVVKTEKPAPFVTPQVAVVPDSTAK